MSAVLQELQALMAWKLERLPRIETHVLKCRRPEGRTTDEPQMDLAGELAFDDDGGLLRLQRYEQRIERSMRNCMKELRTMQETYAVEETYASASASASTSVNPSASASASATAGSASGVGGSPETSEPCANEEHRSRSTATCGTGGSVAAKAPGSDVSQPVAGQTYAELLGSFGQVSDNEAACAFDQPIASDPGFVCPV